MMRFRIRALCPLCVLCVLCGSYAGAPRLSAAPQDAASIERELASYRRMLADWAGLNRYGSENTEIKPPAPGENRVVFIGDEITETWGTGASKFFPGKAYYN